MRAWYRARQARKAQRADDRLHGRNAKPSRSYRGGSGRRGGRGSGNSDGWGDAIGDVLGDLFEALFKIFD